MPVKVKCEVDMDPNLQESISFSEQTLGKIRYFIAVAAGKGGVGKSSVSVNLALVLQNMGYNVGVLDADIYGPSLAKMLPPKILPRVDPDCFENLLPAQSHGLQTMSISYLREENEAMIVRAPIANGVIIQFLKQVSWGELDYLIVDFPPGTGDVQLTLMQSLPFSGALLVTTPQDLALIDVRKAAHMFHQMGIPILGVIENMSYFEEPSTKLRHYIFGSGGGKRLSDLFGAPFLGEIPLDPSVCSCGDQGLSLLATCPESSALDAYKNIAKGVRDILFDMESCEGNYLKRFELIWQEKE